MKKTVWVFSLLVMLLSQIITPYAYAVGDESPIEESVIEETVETLEVVEEESTEEATEP